MADLDEHVAKTEITRLEQYIDDDILLVGGLAVQQYRRGRASQDIDLVCSLAQQKKFDSEAYPSTDYHSESLHNDLRPSVVYTNLTTGLKVFLGTKILEREPYEFIRYDDYFADSVPYRYNDIECQKIRVPAPHHLAFSKLLSFMARRDTKKGQQDLSDFSDLTNHKSFSLILFITYAQRVGAKVRITKFLKGTRLTRYEKELLSSSSAIRAQRLMPNFNFGEESDTEGRTAIHGTPEEILNRFSHSVAEAAKKRGLSTVRAVSHTGQVSIRALAKVLDSTTVAAEDVRVLVRTPDYEDYFRGTAINRTIEDIKDFGYRYRYYSSPPFVHGFLVEYLDGSRHCLYSFYLHQENDRTKIDESAYFGSGRTGGSFYSVFVSWFDYHWGKAGSEVIEAVRDGQIARYARREISNASGRGEHCRKFI